MKAAYVDTSVLVALAFAEPQSDEVAEALRRCDRLLRSDLLEAEFRSVLTRESVARGGGDLEAKSSAILDGIDWILPDRPLSAEMQRVCEIDYLRGADLWHLACALFVSPDASRIAFLSLDTRQATVARRLGFPPGPPD